MNSASPLIPQGSNLEQENKVRSSLRVKIFCAIGVNVVVLLVLLMQGCKREQPPVAPVTTEPGSVYDNTNPPPEVTNPGLGTVTDMTGSNITSTMPPETHQVVPAANPPAVPAANGSEYKIEKGDSFFTIGKKFGVSAKALMAANPTVDPTKLQIGKAIQIPVPTSSVSTATGPVVNVATGETTYKVKSGDTLGKLATQFGTTVKAIQAANGLADTRIKVGQDLKIPAKTAKP